MMGTLLGCSALFLLCIPGLGWPLARRLRLPPLEQLGVAALAGLLAVYLWSGTVFLLHLRPPAFLLLPIAAAIALGVDWRGTRELARHPDLRGCLGGWLILSAWCLGGAMFIVVHSGGTWAADWWEHLNRALWFLQHLPMDTRFLTYYELPARPPLVNLVTSAFLGLTKPDYAHYQIFTVWLSTLIYVPAAIFARRFGARHFAPLTLACMLSPLVVQNATFPWTKLAAGFGVLLGVYFFLRYRDEGNRTMLVLAAAAFAAAMLAHYSAGPYIVVLALLHAWSQRGRWPARAWWRDTAISALTFTLLFGTWIGWSLRAFGWRSTFLSNSSVMTGEATLTKLWVNFWCTLIPHPFREMPPRLEQANPWVYVRDWVFMVYQPNLPLALGTAGSVVVCWLLWRNRRSPAGRFWAPFLAGTIVLGTAVHGTPDRWGLAHICLQPLVVLGLALLAGNWSRLGNRLRLALAVGWTVDGMLGLVLHFAAQNLALDRWYNPTLTIFDWMAGANHSAQLNFGLKFTFAVDLLGDLRTQHAAVLLAFLGALLALTALQSYRARDKASSPADDTGSPIRGQSAAATP